MIYPSKSLFNPNDCKTLRERIYCLFMGLPMQNVSIPTVVSLLKNIYDKEYSQTSVSASIRDLRRKKFPKTWLGQQIESERLEMMENNTRYFVYRYNPNLPKE